MYSFTQSWSGEDGQYVHYEWKRNKYNYRKMMDVNEDDSAKVFKMTQSQINNETRTRM